MTFAGEVPEVRLEKRFGVRLDALLSKILSEFAAAGIYTKLAERTPAWRSFLIARDPYGLDLQHGAGNVALKYEWPSRSRLEVVAFVIGTHKAYDQVKVFDEMGGFTDTDIGLLFEKAETWPIGKVFVETSLPHLPPPSPKHWMPAKKAGPGDGPTGR